MSKLATLAVAVGALALALVTLAPSSAAGRMAPGPIGAGDPGPQSASRLGPSYGWYGPRRYWRPRYPVGYPYAYYPYWRNRYYGW